ncbi:MAG: desulfoferrodoxin [Candidatus Peregrinibacteria bacterium]|nr:desulfoferrodoxin [Candidatus Peregrinibacteria bacterium]
MTKLNEIYKCSVCGNIVGMAHAGAGELVCCGVPMNLQSENTVDAATEKHVPVIEKTEKGVLVKVGDVAHPMDDDHYIEWIEVITASRIHRKYLKPGSTPEAKFQLCKEQEVLAARAYCNLHGLWK